MKRKSLVWSEKEQLMIAEWSDDCVKVWNRICVNKDFSEVR